MDLLLNRGRITSSGSGGIRDTQAMLDFAAAHDITADVEILPANQVQVALDRLERNDVQWRFVLDFQSDDA